MPQSGQGKQVGILIRGADGSLWFMPENGTQPRQMPEDEAALVSHTGRWEHGTRLSADIAERLSEKRPEIDWEGVFFFFAGPP
jgi:uncharacterized protein (DUF58 family)